ncbi:MAG: aminotransferase class I/II-fold pyridoxal phosphate-dependent enzyme [Pseudomonadota bacterium]
MKEENSVAITARRVQRVHYAVRDVVLVAREAKQSGKELLSLNIGDPNQFDFETPPHIVEAICRALRDNRTCYAPSEGLPEALEAIRGDAERKGFQSIEDVFVGNGASECIELVLAALINEGEGVLTPAPGYPLYSAVLSKFECREIPYFLDESDGWQPDLDDIESKIDAQTRAIVVINPNNPTGSVCEKRTLEGVLELAARHNLVVLADEIYDRLILDGRQHVAMASLTDEVPIFSMNGLSKAYLGPGLRLGWCVVSGKRPEIPIFKEAVHKFLRARLCANHPVQYAVVPALEGDQSHIKEMIAKLTTRRDITANMLNSIDGISCVSPKAAFYAFPRLEIEEPDEDFVTSLIRETGVVAVHGSGFGQRPGTAHFRVVFLPPEDILRKAFEAIGAFFKQWRLNSRE